MIDYSRYTKRRAITKTIRFRLIPYGETGDYLREREWSWEDKKSESCNNSENRLDSDNSEFLTGNDWAQLKNSEAKSTILLHYYLKAFCIKPSGVS